jgi:hypothetical protein
MHCPPRFNGRFAPHAEWGFDIREGDPIDGRARVTFGDRPDA